MNKIRIGIVGYGNLGKGVESVLRYAKDMELIGIFTRRTPSTVLTESTVQTYHIDEIKNFIDSIDVMILCGGSATDLPTQGPEISKLFNTVDSFDTHANIPDYITSIEKSNLNSNKISIVSVGWDPGLFSIIRVLGEAFMPNGNTYTFWGKGVSQGHSDAIRRIKGVKDAIEYTIPLDEAIEKVRNLENPILSIKEKHLRECYVVLEDEKYKATVEYSIKNMPNYFLDYNTIVNFISEEELKDKHSKLTHGGRVMRTGITESKYEKNNHLLEYSLELDSNPHFTASILVAYARAAYKLNIEGETGVKTVFDIPLKYLIDADYYEVIKKLL